MKEYDRQAEALLEAPCHIVDFLPQTVSEDAPGQYNTSLWSAIGWKAGGTARWWKDSPVLY